jgi:Glycosyltransferase family 87/WD40-like Beta Propeller Repeat
MTHAKRVWTTARVEYVLALCALAWFASTTLRQAWTVFNSDFSNYFLTAHLLRDHSSTARVFEWIWFQRQKDHLGLQQSFVAMEPITPFSAIFLWPLTHLAPLAAKHVWLAVNAGLLWVSAWMLVRMTGIRASRMALLIAVSYPLERHMQNGQFYLPVLFLLTLGLWFYLRGQSFGAGAAVAVAVGLKVSPVLFALYFARRRDWRAVGGALAGGVGVAAISIAAFGWQLNRAYMLQVLPRAMLGESIGPYNLTLASFAVLFHRLFIFEPTLNPHPAVHAAWLLPALLPVIQFVVLVPLVLLVKPRDSDPSRVALEWSAVVLASLLLSPLPASYHFVLLFLPMAILLGSNAKEMPRGWLVAVVLLYLAIGFPFWPGRSGGGWLPLLHVPRLYATIALYGICLLQLRGRGSSAGRSAVWDWAWVGALASIAAVGVVSGLHAQRNFGDWYNGRLDIGPDAELVAVPQSTREGVAYIAMKRDRYHAYPEDGGPGFAGVDDLAQAIVGPERWVERTAATSQLVSIGDGEGAVVLNGESPVLSTDGKWLAFEREEQGRASLWLHSLLDARADAVVTPPEFDVLEASFAPDGGIVFAALKGSGAPALFLRGAAAGEITKLFDGEARYPAISPDGGWLAYSGMEHGSWNLRLRDLRTGKTRVLTDASCDFVESAWESDSHTLLYASDCGRGYGETALYRRRVVP